LIVCEIDLHVGGAYRYVMQAPDGSEHPFKGGGIARSWHRSAWFTPNLRCGSRIQDIETLVTVLLRSANGKTTMTETILHPWWRRARDISLRCMGSRAPPNRWNKLEELLTQI
jgi:uncharacterized protein YndB with AHSA1/START domain